MVEHGACCDRVRDDFKHVAIGNEAVSCVAISFPGLSMVTKMGVCDSLEKLLGCEETRLTGLQSCGGAVQCTLLCLQTVKFIC